ncbi:hypothetical protein F6P35_04675 [Streptococcus suis]|nr:hypothetical protein [Streptococcus suis]MBS7985870.1 hypothetical protein [Streptococcus suis]MBS8009553.1 hypothetical protein [Streptococcus suis]
MPYSAEVTCFASYISNLAQPLGCASNLHLGSLSESSSFDYIFLTKHSTKKSLVLHAFAV